MNVRVFLIFMFLMSTVACDRITNVFISNPPDTDNTGNGYFVRSTVDDQDVNKRNKSIIIFIHGVIGDHRETWVNRENMAYWPEIVKQDCELGNFDIYVASYYSPLLKTARTIAQLGEKLRFDLRDVIDKYEYIVVIGHSMGNLVFRHAAYVSNAFDDVGNVLLLSMGSPSNGGEPLSNIASMISDNPQFSEMIKVDYNSYLDTLNSIQRKNPKNNIEIACAYELQPLTSDIVNSLPLGKIKVVDQGSATAVCTRPDYMGIFANHIDMVKPKNVEDDIHQWIKNELKAKINLAPKIVLMDSPTAMYRPGTMNLTDIKNQLQKSSLSESDVIQIPISEDMNSYGWVTEGGQPDLVIIHYSGFFKDEKVEADRAKAFELGSQSLRLFLKRIMEDTLKTKILIYSRWHENHHGLKLGAMNEYVDNFLLGDLPDEFKERIYVYDVNSVNVPAEDLNFNNSQVFGGLLDNIVNILSAKKSLIDCSSK